MKKEGHHCKSSCKPNGGKGKKKKKCGNLKLKKKVQKKKLKLVVGIWG